MKVKQLTALILPVAVTFVVPEAKANCSYKIDHVDAVLADCEANGDDPPSGCLRGTGGEMQDHDLCNSGEDLDACTQGYAAIFKTWNCAFNPTNHECYRTGIVVSMGSVTIYTNSCD